MKKQVNITLVEETKRTVRESIEAITDFSCTNEKRFAKYGILTGLVSESFLSIILTMPGVEAVELDQVRRV